MISSRGAWPARAAPRGGAEDRARPASRRSRGGSARAARRACRASGCPPRARATRSSVCSSVAAAGAPRSRASVKRSTSSKRSGRNSCSGGSSSRIVTGRPSMASKRPSKSACWSGSSSSSAARRPASSSAMIIRCIFGLAVGGHEHVLGPAQADALGAELARAAGVLRRVGVRADAERAQLVAPAEHGAEAIVDLRRRPAARRRA